MDLSARKYKFIEQFMKIVSPEKIERLEQLLKAETSDNDVVVYDINDNEITRETYIKNNQDAVAEYKKGNYKTQSQMRKKYSDT